MNVGVLDPGAVMRDDPSVVALVEAARDGDKRAWDTIVDRYAPLVWSVCRRYDLSPADAEDVGGNVWLLLIEHLAAIRQPAALPGWIATTTQRACFRLLRGKNRQIPVDEVYDTDRTDDAGPPVDDRLLREERRIALRTAFRELPPRCQELLAMLFRDPPTPYQEISAAIGMKVPSIGPTRMRCLDRLRQQPALAAFADGSAAGSSTDGSTTGPTDRGPAPEEAGQ